MKNPDVRAKVSSTLKSMGWRPTSRKGNGHTTEPQRLFAAALGWPMEVAIPTKLKGNGYPTAYKVDIGHPECRVAVEVDGPSHCSLERKAQDAKKDALLALLGWKVLRFSNREVMDDLAGCVRTVLSTTSK